MIFRLFYFPSMSTVLWQQTLEIALSKNAATIFNDIALYQLFGRDYLRCGPFSLYLFKFQAVHVRLRKRSNSEFFIQISDK